MLFRQFVDADLGCASYLIGSDAGRARRSSSIPRTRSSRTSRKPSATRCASCARSRRTTHADHVSGHGRLALEHGAPRLDPPARRAGVPVRADRRRRRARVGEVAVRVLHTPGHRPEHCSLLVDERLLLTGDSLFVGDAARPGPRRRGRGRRGGPLPQPPPPRRAPGRRRGVPRPRGRLALRGRDELGPLVDDRRTNAVRTPRSRSTPSTTSSRRRSSKNAPRPPNMDAIVALNRGPFLGARRRSRLPAELGGATVLDVRDAEEFAAGHLPARSTCRCRAARSRRRPPSSSAERPVVLHASSAGAGAGGGAPPPGRRPPRARRLRRRPARSDARLDRSTSTSSSASSRRTP